MLSTEQERHAAAATVDRLTSMGLSYSAAAAVIRTVLGDVLVDLGFCDRDTVEAAARAARERGLPIGGSCRTITACPTESSRSRSASASGCVT